MLDRLEYDPCADIRQLIARRLLLSRAQDPLVEAALRTAAADDQSGQVRWAARYALYQAGQAT